MGDTDSVELFSLTALRALSGYTQIDTFRRTGLDSIGNFNSQLRLEAGELADEFAYDEYYSRFLDQSKLSDEALGENVLASLIYKQKYLGFLYTLNSSCLVFTHSILDGILFDFCKSTFSVAPEAWEQFVSEKSIKLGALKNKKYNEIFEELVEGKLKDIDRLSVVAKTEMLFKLCKPVPKNHEPKGYTFSKIKLSEICDMRNTIVHSPHELVDMDNIDEDLNYLQETGRYFLSILNLRFDLKIDPNAAVLSKLHSNGVGGNSILNKSHRGGGVPVKS